MKHNVIYWELYDKEILYYKYAYPYTESFHFFDVTEFIEMECVDALSPLKRMCLMYHNLAWIKHH